MNKYQFDWGGHYPLCLVEPSIKRHHLVRSFLNQPAKNDTFTFSKNKATQSFTAIEDQKLLNSISQRFFDHKFVNNLFNESEKTRQKYKEIYTLLKNPLNNLNQQEIAQYYKLITDNLTSLLQFFELTRPEYQEIIEEKIRGMVSNEILNDLLASVEPDEITKEKWQWLLFCASKPKENDLIKYVDNNTWVFPGIKSQQGLIDYAWKRYEETKKSDLSIVQEKINNEKKEFEERGEKQKELFSNEEVEFLAKLFQNIGLERIKIKKCWVGSWNEIIRLLKEVSVRKNVDLDHLLHIYRRREVIRLLLNNIKLSEQEINKRDHYVLRYLKGRIHFLTGADAKSFIKKIEEDQSQLKIKGNTAYKGIVRGKVRIVPNADINSLKEILSVFEKGDILVTTMTQPSMVVLMEKAGAIITDEGGITSHAAIISREFKIPCIVGARVAMKKLKDGDLVEVNADKGIVKVLEKK
jgi:pyruvate,water dikinase